MLILLSITLQKHLKMFLNKGRMTVMNLLNHSSEAMTLTYLGLDQASRETMLDQIDFG